MVFSYPLFYIRSMDRKRHFGNVAFGGAWSQQIAPREEMDAALDVIDRAARDSCQEDVRLSAEVRDALGHVTKRHPKGAMLRQGWDRAARIQNSRMRLAELCRIAALLRAGIG